MPLDLSPLWVSLKTSACATVLTFFLGLGAARAMLAYRGRGRELIDGILALPLVLPPTVIGFFLLLLFGRRSTIGQLLEHVGITIAFSWPATVIAATVVAFPLMYRTALGAFEQVNPTLLQAAETLGASQWRVFRRVLLPLAWPGVVAGTVLAFARALGEFGATLMLAGNIPGRTQTMPVAVFFAAEGNDMNRALAWVLLLVAVSLAVITMLNYRARSTQRVVRKPNTALPAVPTVEAPIALTRRSEVVRKGQLTLDLEKSLGNFRLKVKLKVENGTLGLLGASGSGKTMTLRCIAGLEIPDAGKVTLNQRVLFDSAGEINCRPAARRIGVVFQDYALFPHLTVQENIAFGIDKLSVEEQRRRTADLIVLVRLDGLSNRYPGELSGGQRQRVALARALAIQPEALVLDEPFSALDPHLRRQLEEELRETLVYFAGPVLLVTHDLSEAFRLSTDLAVMAEGQLVAYGPKAALFEQPGTVTAARLTGCKNISPALILDAKSASVPAWGTSLRVAERLPDGLSHVGIRAHHIEVGQDAAGENVFPCWLIEITESPFEITIYVRLHQKPKEGDHPHLEIDVSRAAWSQLASKPQPWYVYLPAERLLPLQESPETNRSEAAVR